MTSKIVPTFEGRLYTDSEPNGIAGNWVRRAEVDALLDDRARGTAALRAAFGEELWALGHPAYVVNHMRQEYAKLERLWKQACVDRDQAQSETLKPHQQLAVARIAHLERKGRFDSADAQLFRDAIKAASTPSIVEDQLRQSLRSIAETSLEVNERVRNFARTAAEYGAPIERLEQETTPSQWPRDCDVDGFQPP